MSTVDGAVLVSQVVLLVGMVYAVLMTRKTRREVERWLKQHRGQ